MEEHYHGPDLDDVGASETVQDAIQNAENNIVSSLDEIREAVRSQGHWGLTPFLFVFCFSFFFFGPILDDKGWESKARYSAYYGVPAEDVVVNHEPRDCDFLRAPLGFKACHYEKIVAVTKVGKDNKTGRAVVSHDNGNTWTWDDLTDTRTVPGILVSYTKVED